MTEFNRARRREIVRATNRVARRYGVRTIDFGAVSNRAAPPMPGQADPETPEQFEDWLGNLGPEGVKAAMDDGSYMERLKAYVENTRKRDPLILQQVKEETERTMVEWLREHGEVDQARKLNLSWDSPMNVGAAKVAQYNPDAPAAALDKEFKNTADFLKMAWDKNPDPQNAERIRRVRNEYSSIAPADGGFLVPERLRAELLRVAVESAIVRSRARVIPMDAPRVPFPMIDSTSNATSIHGGVVAYWTKEGAALTESTAKFGRVVLDANKLTAYADVPTELLQDSIISLAAFIEEIFPEAIAWFEDVAFLTGTGVGEPLGVLTTGNTATVEAAKESGQAADTIVWENIIKMYARMLPTSLGRAVWLVPPSAFPELATMALSVGTGGGPVWLNNGAGGPPMTILGRPAIVTEKAPKLGDAKDVSLVDFGYYLIGDRMQMRAESSTHYRFGNDETSYRVIQRVDGRPWIKSAITPQNGGDTLSPFVTLAERA